MASSYPPKICFSILGPCWSYLMFWCNLIISKTRKQAYLMISLGIRGMEIIFCLYIILLYLLFFFFFFCLQQLGVGRFEPRFSSMGDWAIPLSHKDLSFWYIMVTYLFRLLKWVYLLFFLSALLVVNDWTTTLGSIPASSYLESLDLLNLRL